MTFPFPFFVPAAASGPSIVAFQGTTDWDAGTTIAAGLPTGYAAGDYLVMIVAGATNSARTIAEPAGWTTLFNAAAGGNLRYVRGLYKLATGSEGSTVTVSASGVINLSSICVAVRGATQAPEAGTLVTATSASVDAPSLTPTGGSKPTVWLAGLVSLVNGITGPSSGGWASTASLGPGGGNTVDCVFGYLSSTASSIDPPAGSLTSASNAANTIAVR